MSQPALERERLIRSLVADLRPVRRPGRVAHWLVTWLSLAVLFSAASILVTGPYRDGALIALSSNFSFAAETLVAAAAVILLARAALKSSMPDAVRQLRWVGWPAAALCLWLGFYVVGLWFPAHPVSNLGHRDHCLAETQLLALINFVPLLWLARRLAPLRPRLTGALAGAAAAAVPASIMQFACMYEPQHILVFHFAPMVVTAATGALLGPALLTRRFP